MKEGAVEEWFSWIRMEVVGRATGARLHNASRVPARIRRHQENLVCYTLELTFTPSR
jgi:hypothetical protein